MYHARRPILGCIWHLFEGVTFWGLKKAISQLFQDLVGATPDFVFLRGVLLERSFGLARLLRSHYFDPHSPQRNAGFGVHMARIQGGRILGVELGHFSGVSGLY